jgi:predicted phosphodiesterase
MNVKNKAAILLTFVITSVVLGGLVAGMWPQDGESQAVGYTFFAIGDTQGSEDLFNRMIEDANSQQPAFVIHLGDITSAGTEAQFSRFLNASQNLEVPLYTTPGNHDIKSSGLALYKDYFGEADYSFEFRSTLFVSVDSSQAGLSEAQYDWLEEELSGGQEHKVVFTHVPPNDPREGEDHAFLDAEDGQRFISLMEEKRVELSLNGHIHMFQKTLRNGTLFVTSGGGGANLYEEPGKGGFYHYLKIHVSDSGMDIEHVHLSRTEPQSTSYILVRNGSSVLNLSLEELKDLGGVQGQSAFENQYGNWRCQGTYEGVLVRDLVKEVGGIDQDDEVCVRARDGYEQRYRYTNIYPNSTVLAIQGEMILAYGYEGQEVPLWEDGFRTVFLPPDTLYSNDDASMTTDADLASGEYVSAGGRWVKYVAEIEVVRK